jgi:cysteine desulfurase
LVLAMKLPIYMDYHATTPVDPRVVDAMLPFFTEKFGNASSRSHAFGWDAEDAVEKARRQVAGVINASPREIFFTSGATESDNLALRGAALAGRAKCRRIITLPIEHKAVLDTCRSLEKEGFEIVLAPVRGDGIVDMDALRAVVAEGALLVAVMAANNEIGVLQPIEEIGKLCRGCGVLFHTDAVQAFGKVPLDVRRLNVDLLSISAHKIYGPKGVGALFVRSGPPEITLAPLTYGGGHEQALRPGTLNVPGIVGLGKASEICHQEMGEESARLGALSGRLREGILSQVPDVYVNGSMQHRLPHNLNLCFAGVGAETLMMEMSDVAVSMGSACTTGTPAPSYVLKALGVSDDMAYSSLRFGLGRFTTQEEVDYVIERVTKAVRTLREFSGESAGLPTPATTPA